jgi:hypothetical protein
MPKRVLLFCPTVKLSHAVFDAIHALHFDGTLDRLFTHDNPYGEINGKNILHNYQKAERIVKAENYDYLLTVEDDIIPPPDALEKMIAVDADIVYGVYCFRRGRPMLNIAKPYDLTESYSLPNNIKDWQTLCGQIIPCGGLGFGCTLIKRSVFNAVSLHSDSGTDADSQLAHDARRLGLSQMCDTTVLCGHRRPDNTIVWPTPQGWIEYGMHVPLATREIIAQRPMAFWDSEEQVIRMQTGEQRAIDFEHAADFVALGLATYAEAVQ